MKFFNQRVLPTSPAVVAAPPPITITIERDHASALLDDLVSLSAHLRNLSYEKRPFVFRGSITPLKTALRRAL